MTTTIESVRTIEKAMAAGVETQITKADAEAALDLLAKAIQDRYAAGGVSKSFEKCYVEGMDESPTLAGLAAGAL